jgi:hypothetical protein
MIKYRNTKMGLTIGVGFDIEFALLNTRGKLVSAIPFLCGTKKTPDLVDGGNIQRDNVAFEIAVDYATQCSELIENTRQILQHGTNKIPKGYRLSCIPSGVYTDKELKHPEAKEFGCDPDYDAKTGTINEFNDVVDPNLRSFGFHVHTGPLLNTIDPRVHALASDLTLGLFSTMKDNSPAALMRRSLYGKPSCYRVKEYGVEYRTLSNYFCKSPRLMKVVWILNYVAYAISRKHAEWYFENVDMHEVSDIIMRGDEAAATGMFFEHVHQYLDYNLQRFIIDELEYDGYGSFQEEWSISQEAQYMTVNQALRPDYFQSPDIIKEMPR